MALDNAQFIAELSVTDPPGSDPLSQGDDHIRTTKRATQQSFPFIDKQVDLTADQLNLAAIKNEANVFTVANQQFLNSQTLTKSSDGENAGFNFAQFGGEVRWRLFQSTSGNGEDFIIARNDALGVFIDQPMRIKAASGVVDFAHVPTVSGAPIWIAGEIRMFAAIAVPGTNWFKCDGLNGTVDLADRAIIGDGISVPGTALAPNVVALASGATETHVLTENQMPAHDHGLLGGSVTGVTAPLLAANARGVYGHGSMTPSYVFTTGFGDNLMQATGLNQAHGHDITNVAVVENGTGRDTVRPLSRVVQFHQYVP